MHRHVVPRRRSPVAELIVLIYWRREYPNVTRANRAVSENASALAAAAKELGADPFRDFTKTRRPMREETNAKERERDEGSKHARATAAGYFRDEIETSRFARSLPTREKCLEVV